MFVVSNSRNVFNSPACDSPDDAEAAIRPLNARSLALSALLGTHPPQLPARAFVALARLFDIPSGTMRTALSRMLANDEIVRIEGRYLLSGHLLDRQRAQDTGRRDARIDWDGRWHTIVTATDQRDVADRRRFRSMMANHRFGELRPDIWMRPANLDAPQAQPEWISTSGSLDGIDPESLVRRLWNLDAIATEAHRFLQRIDELETVTDWHDVRSIPEVFTTSAAIVRFLRSEPLLPPGLTPAGWPVSDLRRNYDRFERSHQALLRSFLRSA